MLEILEQYGSLEKGFVTLGRSRHKLVADAHDLQEAIHRHEKIRDIDGLIAKARRNPDLKMVSPGPGFVVNTGSGAVSLSAATAKTLWYLNSGTNYEPTLAEFSVSFDGVTSSAVPVLIELCYGTKASNSTPGTGSVNFTPLQIRGFPPKTPTVAAGTQCSSEPTVLVSLKQWLLTPAGGLLVIQAPLGREATGLTTASTSGLQQALRLNAPAAVGARSYCEFEE